MRLTLSHITLPLALLLSAVTAQVASAAAPAPWPRAVVQSEPRAVVELFTSPNCSACPPADALFEKLAKSPDLFTLVMPVDLWNRPGRKDTLAVRAFTERQMAYADVRNENTLYTPQAMVNGAVSTNGADASEIGTAVAQTQSLLSVPVSASAAGDDIVVSVGAATSNATPGFITVLPFVASRTVKAYGERITYANLVRDIVRVADWEGKPVRRTVRLRDFSQYDGVVVLLQAGTEQRPGVILGATRISLSAPKT